MKIRFLRDEIYETEGYRKGPSFTEGQILDSSEVQKALGLKDKPKAEWIEGFLMRWVNLDAAEVYVDPPKAAAPAAAEKPVVPADPPKP